MIFKSQNEATEELNKLAATNRQSVIIEGPSGSGKSYLSKEYANLLQVTDYMIVQPKVAEIREALDSSQELGTPVVLCIENLDLGVAAASYTLLKSLEEPAPNVYIVITCRNMKMIPDTIVSRSAVVTVGPPTNDDIDLYGQSKNKLKFNLVKERLVWQCTRSFADVDNILEMTNEEVDYYESLSELCHFKDNIANMTWTIGHYKSGKDCNIELAIRSIMELMHKPFITQIGIQCLRDLNQGRIAQHAVLAKFLFNAKYCE